MLLKPHIWTRGGWSGSIAMKNEEDWARWFAGYRGFILHYADLAERSGAEALAVGTELGGTTAREREWRAIVAEVRRHYHGTLVYCANWAEDLHHTQFWDALDWIGVQAYYPLCDQRAPTTQALVRGWSGPLADLETIAKIWGKPVVLTEVGYHSLDTAAIRPWEWDLPGSLSMETQAFARGGPRGHRIFPPTEAGGSGFGARICCDREARDLAGLVGPGTLC
ncbi:MAG: hypothetical protein E6K75_00690 [Candidatus Eisenbacteria bacterium]|uniref:Uncharacterized protein n=1 Tax=Eiseniibacteriota bacterium TaxID=2212470 RepID=A0A538TDV7_UNCEI|nr:MAG: hypothetical protein E6K75_00690 [Candidatus Eisenbacteria bacterium]